MNLSGWGRYPRIDAKLSAPRDLATLRANVHKGNAIARGNGRAYGDSAVSTQNTIHMKHFNRMLGFDTQLGQLVAESGVLLADIIDAFLPRGWFPYVTPGTKFVTLGGLIAADVHGKNHHKDGSFAKCVDWIELLTCEGDFKRCSATENTELFEWTVGGMGLTGVIIRAAIRLRPVSSTWIEQRTMVAENISHAIEIFEKFQDTTYSVAWIDCLQHGNAMGRSLVMLGEHAKAENLPSEYHSELLKIRPKRKLRIPLQFPNWVLNNFSVRVFNALYYSVGKRQSAQKLIDWDSYFYPLDTILDWNKIYGRRGFAQYQCVIPIQMADEGLRALLSTISGAGIGSFLAVLKRFGTQESKFSFPMEGYTLALDLPVNTKTLALMEQLDTITLQYGGRFYLAKDSRMSRFTFQSSEPRATAYSQYRSEQGLNELYCSTQSERLGI
ncbi:MAG: FAD-binding oxidoreductase [Alphaproteobacteria bacterium]|nr:FAD-binding oxidoreductase [Alphaproteobacteria bacterium]